MARSGTLTLVAMLLAIFAGGCDALLDQTTSSASLPTEPTRVDFYLGAQELVRGLDARSIVVRDDALTIAPWAAAATGTQTGRIVTSVIDLSGDADVSLPTRITDLHIRTFGRTLGPSRIVTWLRHGSTFFQSAGWTDWQLVSTLSGPQKSAASSQIDLGDDCYAQVCVDLDSRPGQPAPTLDGAVVSFVRKTTRRFDPPIAVPAAGIERIVRSTIGFDYGRCDQQALVWLRKNCRLDDVVAKPKDELGKLIALNDWVSRRPSETGPPRKTSGWAAGPWDLHDTFKLDNGGAVTAGQFGYCQLFLAAATAMGWHGRQIVARNADGSSRDMVEVWLNTPGQWVCFVPWLGAYYVDPAGHPLSAADAREAAAEHFRDSPGTRPDMEAVLAQMEILPATMPARTVESTAEFHDEPIRVSINGLAYGKANAQARQAALELLRADYLRMTPHSLFGPATGRRVGLVSPCWLPSQADELLPMMLMKPNGQLDGRHEFWTWRRHDWNWTLDQASMKLVRTGPRQITVELGNSQPFFKKYIAIIDGRAQQVSGSRFVWRLSRGVNLLSVSCLDEFNQDGIPSFIRVRLGN